MLPMESLFDRFPRIVRDLAKALDKEVELTIEGRETRLDRTVIEEISDPLIHLVRNAVDHGLEATAERERKGKDRKGKVRLTAAHEENKVVITVEDDGAGIDAQKIRDSAVNKGIVSRAETDKMSDLEAIYLIFRPGFSTASVVSDISGRGVRMDIVRNHIEKLNGMIDIQTELGRGTMFRIKLPMTLAIIPGLLVGVGGDTFVIPMTNVAEIVRVNPDSIQYANGTPSVLLRGQVIPLTYLRDKFNRPVVESNKKYLPVVVVGTAERRSALVVDELLGNQEIVKKSLGANVALPDGISGVTILGDGRVGLIIDVSGI
ncbi:chemotaxis protein CheA [Alicyclobacillus dauci]|uniref:histidine kinase n=1 Tax=Alicyclobacillus dauci TaxID=1475485 RepID=A0ABY6Z2G8_9BACL|nr:chemotaxis protein CheA [Alicyclobacillus dauci]WAH36479.1 chemotaxis protein CheA [Alicyclobacillus dauci]